MPSPLHNLTQAIHIPRPVQRQFLLAITSPQEGQWRPHLYCEEDDVLYTWTYNIQDDSDEEDQEILAQAVREGMVHLDLEGKRRLVDLDSITLIPPGEAIRTYDLSRIEDTGQYGVPLLRAALQAMTNKPAEREDGNDIREIQVRMTQRDTEIAHLNAKLASAKATAARSSQSEKPRPSASPQKKPPANASKLQPNQKRRKAIEDEFAGSDSDDEENDD